ncbi:hypothetical protein MRX96_012423 [Rhipicephalus microplus]
MLKSWYTNSLAFWDSASRWCALGKQSVPLELEVDCPSSPRLPWEVCPFACSVATFVMRLMYYGGIVVSKQYTGATL